MTAAPRPQPESIYFTTRDGLKLHARHFPAPGSKLRPVLCLAGLTRNSKDFNDLATALAAPGSAARPVYALDYRGRGLSDFDSDWKNYAIPIEMLDVIDFITMTGIFGAAVVGTSRGGLIALVMAAAQPATIGAAVLNDIGPVIETQGLARIAGFVGRTPLPQTWDAATKLVRGLNEAMFPAIPAAQWEEFARAWFNDKDGRPAPGYDAKLSRALSVLDGPIPALWPQFEALKRVPVMVLRGETSDLLSDATVQEMRRRHPALEALTVPGQGHAPLLKDTPTIAAISRFIASTDAEWLATHANAA